jgi:hypothetical protein
LGKKLIAKPSSLAALASLVADSYEDSPLQSANRQERQHESQKPIYISELFEKY